MGNYRPFLQGPLPVANYTRIIIPGRFWTRPPSTKSTRMASSATPLHDSLIELAIPDAHAHAIKWYLNTRTHTVCPPLTLDNGTVSYSMEMGVERNVGNVATHTCISGYRLLMQDGGNTRTCNISGWSGQDFICGE